MFTTFQAFVHGVLQGFASFVPVSSTAHHELASLLLGWNAPSGELHTALLFGTLVAVLVYFRHDWASIFSSGLQVALFWKRPLTLDERMPLFLVLSAAPMIALGSRLEHPIDAGALSATALALTTVLCGLPLLLAERLNRKTKNMFSWNWVDSLLVGLTQVLALVPGAGAQVGALTTALFRNYNREAAAKFVFFAMMPILLAQTIAAWRTAPLSFGSWDQTLPLGVGLIVSTLTGLLVIGAFMKSASHRSVGVWSYYRFFLGAAILGAAWWRGHL